MMRSRTSVRTANREVPDEVGAAGGETMAVQVWNLKKQFRRRGGDRVTAVDDVSIAISAGELVVLLGPSGCGKTTLLRCIAGLEDPDEGRIEINGVCVFDSYDGVRLAPDSRNVSMMFQSYALWPHMTAYKNVEYAVRSRRFPKDQVDARVTKALEQVGIPHLRDQYPAAMSGGQQQRVALARSLAVEPPVVLFDEPLSNVDAKVREKLRQELVSMQRGVEFAGVYVTHDQLEAMQLADKLAVMRNGRIDQIDTPVEVYRRPASRYVANFIGQANELEGTVTEVRQGAGPSVTLKTALGPIVVELDDPTRYRVGARAHVIIRPEDLRFAPADGDGTEAGSPNTWEGTVLALMFSGAHVEYQIVIDGHQLHGRSDNRNTFPEDAVLSISAAPDAVRIFPESE